MFDQLESILNSSGLGALFEERSRDDRTDGPQPHVAYRVKSNIYRIRAFELWGTEESYQFRIYHGSKMSAELKDLLKGRPECISSLIRVVDFQTEDYLTLAVAIKEILLDEEVVKVCKESGSMARTTKFEGLKLPDVDMTDETVLGRTFTWADIIAIFEDESEENVLKAALSRKGIYIQRSKDGVSRYIGSAYGSNGILGRWMEHLTSNGNAHHLNLFVLENGYNEIVFSVIEFYEEADIIQREAMWKKMLATINYGPYNGLQLNRN